MFNSTDYHQPAEHWLVRVTERWRARGESPGSNPRLSAPTYVGHTVEEWEDDAEDDEEEADEELTDITE